MTDHPTPQSDTPTVLLRALAARATAVKRPLPQGDSASAGDNRYIAFRLAGVPLATPMAEVKEILSYPDLTAVPGAKRWLKGIAQVRGRLMSIVDVQDFLGGDVTALRRTTRVLLAEHDDILCGFIVDEVVGMKQHLSPVGDVMQMGAIPVWLDDSVDAPVCLDNTPWRVLEFAPLMRRPAFLQAAA
ncbi:MAG: chemotaxis protein CheW [Pseudomonadota bacterium]